MQVSENGRPTTASHYKKAGKREQENIKIVVRGSKSRFEEPKIK